MWDSAELSFAFLTIVIVISLLVIVGFTLDKIEDARERRARR